jgi:N utilization substance protein B
VTDGEGDSGSRPGAKGVSKARGVRTRGRILALQMVYSFEQNRYQSGVNLVPEDDSAGLEPEAKAFALALFEGFSAQRPAVDAAIDQRLENWTLGRLAVIDRALMRLGAYELLYTPDTPPKVAINEYIELAKQYGTEAKTARLVNGVLDRIARDHRADEVTPRAGGKGPRPDAPPTPAG